MYGVVELKQTREMQDPKLVSLEAYQTYEEALARSNVLLDQFLEDYGEDYYERATFVKPMASASNGDVDWWAYIRKFDNDITL